MKRCKISELLSNKALFEEFKQSMAEGNLAIVPTDTIYGIAAFAERKDAVKKVYEVKHRSEKKPLILFVSSPNNLFDLGFNISNKVFSAVCAHWPGALTAIFNKPDSKRLSAFSFEKIGVRMPAHQGLLALLKAVRPLYFLTTSANRSGIEPCREPSLLQSEFENEIAWLIEDGVLKSSLPSTVADFTKEPPVILRQGTVLL